MERFARTGLAWGFPGVFIQADYCDYLYGPGLEIWHSTFSAWMAASDSSAVAGSSVVTAQTVVAEAKYRDTVESAFMADGNSQLPGTPIMPGNAQSHIIEWQYSNVNCSTWPGVGLCGESLVFFG